MFNEKKKEFAKAEVTVTSFSYLSVIVTSGAKEWFDFEDEIWTGNE